MRPFLLLTLPFALFACTGAKDADDTGVTGDSAGASCAPVYFCCEYICAASNFYEPDPCTCPSTTTPATIDELPECALVDDECAFVE